MTGLGQGPLHFNTTTTGRETMNTTLSHSAQAPLPHPAQVFPQPIPASIITMDKQAAMDLVLALFDQSAIPGPVAEDWLIAIEDHHQIS